MTNDTDELTTWSPSKHCETAEELIDTLCPHNSDWRDWIFRGQSKTWALYPQLQRKRALDPFPESKRFYGEAQPNLLQSPMKRQDVERFILRQFAEALDAAGFAIPGDSDALRANIMDFESLPNLGDVFSHERDHLAGSLPWPPRLLFQLIALAQHHGLPTSLLDWTRLARNAIYFAAAGFIEDRTPSKSSAPAVPDELESRLAIWALNASEIREYERRVPNPESIPPAIRSVRVSRASNPNLNAQAGLFTTVSGAQITSLEETVSALCHDGKLRGRADQVLRLYTVPCSQAGRLLQLMSFGGVTASTMYPGYDGVARALKERQFYE